MAGHDDGLARVLAGFGGRRVLVVGDLMVDEYLEGDSDRLSAEAPVPVIGITREAWGLGGAANVAHQLVALGADVALCGVVGDDPAGALLLREAAALGIGLDAVLQVGDRRTTRKLRVLSGGQQVARLDWEDVHPLGNETVARLVRAVEAIGDLDAVVISDYAKGVLGPALTAHVIEHARHQGVLCLVDPTLGSLDRYRGAQVVKANLAEFRAACDAAGVAGEDEAAAAELLAASPVGALVVTRGGKGTLIVGPDGSCSTVATKYVDVADVAGAGDIALAVLALAMSGGTGLLNAAQLASRAAEAAVRKVGVAVVTPDEVVAELDHDWPGSGILTPTDAARTVAGWQRDGERVVFTNGCFDLFHPGHRHLLEAAARHGDRLVVAVNSDSSTRALKGDERPVLGEQERMAQVASLDVVDAVVLMQDLTPLALVDALRPDVLVKGADYRVDEVVGADLVLARGGTVELVPHLPGHSTSASIVELAWGPLPQRETG